MIKSLKDFLTLFKCNFHDVHSKILEEQIIENLYSDIIKNNLSEYDKEILTLNEPLPSSILNALVRDDSWRIRFFVAGKKNLSYDLLQVLAKDSDETVRGAIANNPRTSFEILRSMYPDENDNVNEILKQRLGLIKVSWLDGPFAYIDEKGDLHYLSEHSFIVQKIKQYLKRYLKQYYLPYQGHLDKQELSNANEEPLILPIEYVKRISRKYEGRLKDEV